MGLFHDRHQEELRAAGWQSRGYLPHFDGVIRPQFITTNLADSVPRRIIQQWRQELRFLDREQQQLLRLRLERHLDQGYGKALLKNHQVAAMVQDALLRFDGVRYQLFAWVVMPNHLHSLMSRFEGYKLKNIIHSLKSYTSHEANKILGRSGQFWMEDYFDRYMRDEEHFRKTVRYIENNPVKADLCNSPGEWPFSSASFRNR